MSFPMNTAAASRWTRVAHGALRGALMLALGLGISACSDNDDEDASPSVNLTPAWSAYESGQWAEAGDAFLQAVQTAPASAEAWCGLGWSRAALDAASGGTLGMDEGVRDAFHRADQLRPDYVEAWAGLAEFHSVQGDTMAALNWALDAAETGGAAWVFTHNSAVGHRSMRKIAAWQLFKLKRYPEAGAQVRQVLPTFSYATGADSLEQLLAGIHSL